MVTGAQVLFKVTSGTYTGWACLLVPVTWSIAVFISWTCFLLLFALFCVLFSFAAMSYCSLLSVPKTMASSTACCQVKGMKTDRRASQSQGAGHSHRKRRSPCRKDPRSATPAL